MNLKAAKTVVPVYTEAYGKAPEVVAWSPGRIEFLGNHTDYNGGEVLGATLNRGIAVAAGVGRPGWIRIRSDWKATEPLELVWDGGELRPLAGGAGGAWANFPLGVLEMMRRRGLSKDFGIELALSSDLPVGAGLSSSAALEVASALAAGRVFGTDFLRKEELIGIAKAAENDFVGMPCGILDQTVVVCGGTHRLVHIDCKTGGVRRIPLPEGMGLWIFNTAEQHSLLDSLYAERSRECRRALEIVQGIIPGVEVLCDLKREGLKTCREALGERLWRRVRHVTGENERVRRITALLEGKAVDGVVGEAIGTAFFSSHESSRVNFENSTEHLDGVVGSLKESEGILGARLTGGGFGGAVLALAGERFGRKEAEGVCRQYAQVFGQDLEVLEVATGPGATVVEGE